MMQRWWDIVFLRWRKRTEEEKKYGGLNRRMMALSLDSFLITLAVAPLVDMVFLHVYGPVSTDLQMMSQQASQAATSDEALRIFFQSLQESGYLSRWLANLQWQIYALTIYTIVCWHFWSATPGKMLCRLKIVDAKTGQPMGDWQSVLRVLGYFISAVPFGLGFLWIGMNKRRRGWHDYLAGTLVVIRTRNTTSAPESGPP